MQKQQRRKQMSKNENSGLIEDTFQEISDSDVVHKWQSVQDETDVNYVTPDWYEMQGVPLDIYGKKMQYMGTFIRKKV